MNCAAVKQVKKNAHYLDCILCCSGPLKNFL